MSKAILVVDMPESCDMCSFYEDDDYCGVPGCGEYIGDYIACRPNFCPLREVPQKKNTQYSPGRNPYITEGWNSCIDEIMRGSEENG